MSKRGIEMTRAQVEAHQRKHGFSCGVVADMAGLSAVVVPPTRKAKGPNKTEAEFALRLKAEFKREPDFETIKLRIGPNCFYTPDYMLIMEGRPWFFEVKGAHIWDDSTVKFKAAKDRYPWASFEMWQKKKGEWRRLH